MAVGERKPKTNEADHRPERLSEETTPMPPVGPQRKRGFRERSLEGIKKTFKDAADWKALRNTPYGLMPALILAVEGIARGFDSSIFLAVLPDIVRDLEINAFSIIAAIQIASFALIFAELGLAYVLDRVRRVPWVAGGTIFSGVFSLFTAGSSSVVLLGVSRFGDSVSSTAGTTPRFSLNSDYYPVDQRGKAFALVGVLQEAGTLFAPLAIGYLVIKTSWRVPFVITGSVMIVVGAAMFFVLKEPVRGYFERKAAGTDEDTAAEAEPPPSFGEAWRTIWGQRTLRRLFISDIFYGIGYRIFVLTYVFYLFQEYGMDAFDRGWLFAVSGVFSLFGGYLAGGIVDSLTERRPQRVMIFSGIVTMVFALGALVFAASPPSWLVYAIFAVIGFTRALLGPARRVFYAQILPAHVRTMGLGVIGLVGIPIIIVSSPFLGQQASWGLAGVIASTVPFFVISGFVDMSAAGFFERDMRSAIASQLASEEYRRAKEAGAGKLLVCRDIDVEYSGVQVLFGVDFDVEQGEIIALLGTNGAGKSTLLRAISGIRGASGGAIVFDGRDITHVPPHEVAGRGVVHMPGGRGVFPGLSVRENLVLGGWLHRVDEDAPDEGAPASLGDEGRGGAAATGNGDGEVSRKVTKDDIEEVLEIFPSLRERLDAKAGTLSGGEQQMVALAQAFLQRPRLLMIDELSLGLAPAVVQELLESVRRIHESGVTIIIVEQSVNVALTIAQRAIFMEKGEVKFFGDTKELLRRPDILRAVYVKGTGAIGSGPSGAQKSDKERRRYLLEEAQPVLQVDDLRKSFGGITAVNDVSFELREGEILGLIGPNGAGKTTIFDLISGYVIPDAGRVVYEGRDVTSMGPDQRAKLQLIRRFQDARLFPSLSVFEAVLVALERKNDVRNMAVTALQLPQVRASERRVRRRAENLIELLGLEAYRDKFVKELSTGLRRITDLACVLAAEPKVLLLDEPSSGIAQAETESLAPLLRRVRHETGCSILIIEHDMPLISSVSDELLALDQGAVVMRGTPDEVLNDPRVIEAYLGTQENVIKRSGRIT